MMENLQFVFLLYGCCALSNVNQARLKLFKKAKKDLEMLPSTRSALKLHILRANYQAKIWLQADQEHIQISSPLEISSPAWIKEKIFLVSVWTTLPPIPDVCL